MVQQPAPSAKGAGSGLRTAGIIAAGVGGAALIGGVILNVKANGMTSDMYALDGYSKGKESDRQTYATLGWVGYGAGAACVATGAVLYYLGVRSGARSASLALVPSIAPTEAGAFVKGAF